MKSFYYSLIFLSICSYILSDTHKCEKDINCLNYFNCIDGTCVHKSVFPFEFFQFIAIIFIMILSLVATTAGMGGGAIYSAVLMAVENFSGTEAFPISTFIILFCSLSTYLLGVKNKIKYPNELFVDYNIVLVFAPNLLLGTKIGVILNKIFPSILLNILLILSLSFSAYKTYHNAKKYKIKEDEKVLENVSEKSKFSSGKTIIYESDLIYNENLKFGNLNDLSENKRSHPIEWDKLKILLILFCGLIVDQLVEGNSKIPSFIGIHKCSPLFWLIFLSFTIFCIIFAKIVYKNIKNKNKNENKINLLNTNNFDITSEDNEKKINKIFMVCFLGGVISGMLGVGGGIIIAPLMLELNINPKVAASTSNFLLMFSSSAATLLFILSGQLVYDYAIVYCILCSFSSMIGSNYITEYLKKTNKNSILIYVLFYLMMISLIILPINGIKHGFYDMANGVDIFEFKSFCNNPI